MSFRASAPSAVGAVLQAGSSLRVAGDAAPSVAAPIAAVAPAAMPAPSQRGSRLRPQFPARVSSSGLVEGSSRRAIALSAAGGWTTPPPGLAAGQSALVCAPVERCLADPVSRAYDYLNFVMDAYVRGNRLRLLQSYNNESGLLTTGFVYDNALAVIAYLANPTSDHMRRAKVLGDAILFAQDTDTAADGRVRQAYFTGPLVGYGGGPFVPGFIDSDAAVPAHLFGFTGTSTGDAAWTGLALARLFACTNERRFLDGALRVANFICETASSPYHHGGFSGGTAADGGAAHAWSSTEHNIDCYALFQLLARLDGKKSWQVKAARARSFVEAMWNEKEHYFHTGTQDPDSSYPDPVSGLPVALPAGNANHVNTIQVPEDAQTWSFLSLGSPEFAGSLDWASAFLGATDTSASANNQLPGGYSIAGVTFSNRSKLLESLVPNGAHCNDRDAVWLEGTAHLAAALLRRGQASAESQASDRSRALACLASLVSAQAVLGVTTEGRFGGSAQTVGLTSGAGGALSAPDDGGSWTGIPLPQRAGIVSASSGFDTGYGFGYFQRQHVGTTCWFLIAALGINPFRL